MMFFYKESLPLDGKLIPIVLFPPLCQTASITLNSSWHVAPIIKVPVGTLLLVNCGYKACLEQQYA